MIRLHVLFASLLGLLGSSWLSPVQATVILFRTTDQAIQQAHRIVRGRVLSKRSLWGPKKRHVYTDIQLKLLEVLKGTAPTYLTIRQLGGTLDGTTTRLPGAARYRTGEEVLLFLEKERQPGFLFVAGLSFGKYEVQRFQGKTYLIRNVQGLSLYRPAQPRPQIAPPTFSEPPLLLPTLRQKIRRLLPDAPRPRLLPPTFRVLRPPSPKRSLPPPTQMRALRPSPPPAPSTQPPSNKSFRPARLLLRRPPTSSSPPRTRHPNSTKKLHPKHSKPSPPPRRLKRLKSSPPPRRLKQLKPLSPPAPQTKKGR